MKNQIKYLILIFIGIIIGIQIVRKNIFPYNDLRKWKNSQKSQDSKEFDINWNLPVINHSNNSYKTIMLPVEFLPKYSVGQDRNGYEKLELSAGKDTLVLSTENVGLILIDAWGSINEDSIPNGMVKRQKLFLQRARNSNVTIIHAPNKPVVDKYPQYHRIKKIVLDSLHNYKDPKILPVFLEYPSYENEVYLQQKLIRKSNKAPVYDLYPRTDRDISIHLKPEDDEYVVESYKELRYVIWRHQLKLLVYMGGATNECMLQRDTGINRFAGIDKERFPISIVVLEDCSEAGGSTMLNDSLFSLAMFEYYKQRISFISKSVNIVFD